MRGRGAEGRVGSLLELKQNLRENANTSVAIILRDMEQYLCFGKSMGELEVALNDAGYNGFFILFEGNVDKLDNFETQKYSGYNLLYEDVEDLSDIDVFLIAEVPELVNFMEFPKDSKVVVYSNGLGSVYLGKENPVSRYWLSGVLGNVADYYIYPSARMNEIPTKEYCELITDYYPRELARGNECISLISGGNFYLDYNNNALSESSGSAVLVAPAPSWSNPNSESLVSLINSISERMPENEIIVWLYPNDHSNIKLLNGSRFGDNVVISSDENFIGVAGRSCLVISDRSSSEKMFYAFASFKPVIEYNPVVGDKIIGSYIGYVVGDIKKLVLVAQEVVADPSIQSKWRKSFIGKSAGAVACFGCSVKEFVETLGVMAAGESKSSWITVQKNSVVEELTEESLCKNIEQVVLKSGHPYGIVYCYKMIREGLKRFSDSPVLHYFAGRIMAYADSHPRFKESSSRGYYYAYLLRYNYEFFKSMRFELAEIELLFEYVLGNEEGVEDSIFERLLVRILQALKEIPMGSEVILGLLGIGKNVVPREEKIVGQIEDEYIRELELVCSAVSSCEELRSCYDIIKAGYKKYPQSGTINYYVGKLLQYVPEMPEIGDRGGVGGYYNCLLENDPEYFENVNLEVAELVQLFRYRAGR